MAVYQRGNLCQGIHLHLCCVSPVYPRGLVGSPSSCLLLLVTLMGRNFPDSCLSSFFFFFLSQTSSLIISSSLIIWKCCVSWHLCLPCLPSSGCPAPSIVERCASGGGDNPLLESYGIWKADFPWGCSWGERSKAQSLAPQHPNSAGLGRLHQSWAPGSQPALTAGWRDPQTEGDLRKPSGWGWGVILLTLQMTKQRPGRSCHWDTKTPGEKGFG